MFLVNNKLLLKPTCKTKISHTRKQKMAYQQKNTKLILKLISTTGIYFHLTLAWKGLHAAIKDNQNNLDMYFVKFTELKV